MVNLIVAAILTWANLPIGYSQAQVGTFPALIGQRGATLPATCSIGQLFFDTDATAGVNIYGCTAANTWALQGDGVGSGTVTGFTAAGADGVSVTVSNSTTVPALTVGLGAITPATVNGVTITTAAAGVLALTGGDTFYLPASGRAATISGTETLTNKTLTNPAITKQTLTTGSTVAWDISAGNMADVTITTSGASIVTPTNVTAGAIALRIIYASSGTVSSTQPFFKYTGGTAPSWSNTNGKIDMITCNVFFTGGIEALCAATLDVR